MKTFLKSFMLNEDGVTALEYALLAGLIAAVIIGSVTTLGTNANTILSNLANRI